MKEKKKSKWKRYLSSLMALVLMVTSVPFTVFADSDPYEDVEDEEIVFDMPATYNEVVNLISGYIDQAKGFKEKGLPEGGTYKTEEAYQAAVNDFIIKAEKDLEKAETLSRGNIRKDLSADWSKNDKDPTRHYASLNEKNKTENALYFFKNGGFSFSKTIWGETFFPYTVSFTYKSSFHPDFQEDYTDLKADKINIVEKMFNTVEALKYGNQYMTAKELKAYKLELAKQEYSQAKAELRALKDNPSSLVNEILANDSELQDLVRDLNILLNSLDDISDIMEKIEELGISGDIINTILEPTGITYQPTAYQPSYLTLRTS